MISLLVLFMTQIAKDIYSMKRKTVNEITHPQQPRSLKKNKSCLLNEKRSKRVHPRSNNLKGFADASAIVDLLISEWLERLDERFRASDQRQFYIRMMNTIEDAAMALSNMLDPLSLHKQSFFSAVSAEKQPLPANNDLFCVCNNVISEAKASKMSRISIKTMIQAQQKQSIQHFNTSKSIISRKSLFKLHKEQQLQRRNGLYALKEEQTGQNDVFEQFLREKWSKQNKNLYFNQEKMMQNKHNEQFSFDYDGTIFPLKKTSIQGSHRIKILNTTCRLLNRQSFENRKQSIISKGHGAYLKIQMEQTQKQNKKYAEGLKRNLSQGRISNTDSTRQLMRICTEADELTFKNRIEKTVLGTYGKLKELKAY